MQKFTRYYEAVAYLEGLSNLPIKGDYMIDETNPEMYLKRMRYFLRLLGNPDRGFKFIHITGTAGKGSVTNMLHEILHASGKSVGSFTSPFVTTSIEKIKVGKSYISPHEFARLVEYIKPYIDTAYMEGPYGRPSYFEIFLAMGLLYFKQKKCEWVVWEVGCGGRYDGTNVIKKPVVTAITNIDYDHMDLLGDTLEKIAYDKAGIVKKGSFFFTSEQRPKLIRLFKRICREKGAQFHQTLPQKSYQEYNESLVRNVARKLRIEEKYIEYGINRSHLQCRFELMRQHPLVILDGAHNRVKVRSTIDNLKKVPYRKLFLVLGMAHNKEYKSILKQIVPLAHHVYFTRFQVKDRKCAHPKELLTKGRGYLKENTETAIFLDPHRALDQAFYWADKNDCILVVGSFFLTGELRKHWYSEEYILEKRRA